LISTVREDESLMISLNEVSFYIAENIDFRMVILMGMTCGCFPKKNLLLDMICYIYYLKLFIFLNSTGGESCV